MILSHDHSCIILSYWLPTPHIDSKYTFLNIDLIGIERQKLLLSSKKWIECQVAKVGRASKCHILERSHRRLSSSSAFVSSSLSSSSSSRADTNLLFLGLCTKAEKSRAPDGRPNGEGLGARGRATDSGLGRRHSSPRCQRPTRSSLNPIPLLYRRKSGFDQLIYLTAAASPHLI